MFGGGGSIQLARVFGIRVGVEPSWFLILFLLIWLLAGDYADQFPGDGTTAFAPGGAVARCCSSAASCCTSWVTPSWRSATGSRSRASTCGCSAAWPSSRATPNSAGEEFRVAAAGPLVTLLIAAGGYAALALTTSSSGADSVSFDPAGGRGDGRRARVHHLHQHRSAGVQPDPGVPAGRRADRAGGRVEGHRQPRQRRPGSPPASDG